jgi:opacity protein-like surface antigen
VFAKVGGFYYWTELEDGWEVAGSQFTVTNGWLPDDRSFKDTANDSGLTWMYGLGLGFDLTERWGINLEYESYQDVEYSVGKSDIDMTSIGIEYRL